VKAQLSCVDRHAPGSRPWFSLLPCEEIDLAGYVRERFGPGVLDLLHSPLYELPVANLHPPRGRFLGYDSALRFVQRGRITNMDPPFKASG
jgi:hypothetical protein